MRVVAGAGFVLDGYDLMRGVAGGDDELIATPLGRVHFAGEHTAGAWAGLMEGALPSGARAASEVLAHDRS